MSDLPMIGSKVRIVGYLAENGVALTGRIAVVKSVNEERRWVTLKIGETLLPAVGIRILEPAV
jgi:hypothetical protein